MLLTTTWMIDWNVCNLVISSDEVGGLSVNVQHLQGFFAFERVQSPSGVWFFRLWRLVVLNDDTAERVRVFSQCSGNSQVHLLFLLRRFNRFIAFSPVLLFCFKSVLLTVIASLLSASRTSSEVVSPVTMIVALVSRPVFSVSTSASLLTISPVVSLITISIIVSASSFFTITSIFPSPSVISFTTLSTIFTVISMSSWRISEKNYAIETF